MKRFKTLNELYGFTGYFTKLGIYENQYIIIREENKKPYLYNKNNGLKIKGLANINKYLEVNNISIGE